MAPDLEDDAPVEPLTLRDSTLEVEHVALRPKPKRPTKKGAGAMAWVVAILLIGGIGTAVALVMTGTLGGGGGGGEATGAATTKAAEADASGESATAAAGADAEAEASEEATQAASAEDVEAEAEPETQAAAVEDDAAVVANADAEEETQADEAQDDAVVVIDDATEAVAAADGEGATTGTDDAAVVATDDAAPAEDTTVAVDDAEATTTIAVADAVVADDASPSTDAAPVAEVVAIAKPPNPAEAKRLNDLGFAARKAGDHATAMARYREAVQADPENVWAHYNLACELALAGKGKEALAELVVIHKLDTLEGRKALAAARKDSDFESLRDLGQFQRLTR